VQLRKCRFLSGNGQGAATITKGGATIQSTAGQDHIISQTSKIYLLYKLKLNLKNILIRDDDYSKVRISLLAIDPITEKTLLLKKIVVDPG
jgi:hypothetical protein